MNPIRQRRAKTRQNKVFVVQSTLEGWACEKQADTATRPPHGGQAGGTQTEPTTRLPTAERAGGSHKIEPNFTKLLI